MWAEISSVVFDVKANCVINSLPAFHFKYKKSFLVGLNNKHLITWGLESKSQVIQELADGPELSAA